MKMTADDNKNSRTLCRIFKSWESNLENSSSGSNELNERDNIF